MITKLTQNKVTFNAHRGVMPPVAAKEQEKAVEKRYVCSANMKLAQYGYTMSSDLFQECMKSTYENFMDFFNELFYIVSEDSRAISQTKPIWPNFPEDAMQADMVDLYIVNILHYLTAGEWSPEFDPHKVCEDLALNENLPLMKQIPLCDSEEIYRYAIQCITGSTPLSKDTASVIFDTLMGDNDFTTELMAQMKDKEIKTKENLALYVAKIFDRADYKDQMCMKNFRSSTDVLRLAAALSGQDVSLAKSPRFRSFTRRERRELLEILENVEKNEGFALRPEQFKRLGEKLHPGEYAKAFPKDKDIFDKVRNGVAIETYNSKLQMLMKAPINIEKLSEHLMLRPGVFARYLDFALRECDSEAAMMNVLFDFTSVCRNVNPRVLVQLINHFRNRNNSVQLATGKGDGASSFSAERDVKEIPPEMCARVSRDVLNQLWQILRSKDSENLSVYIDPDCHCNKLIFPDNPRQVTSAMHATACGSRASIPAGNNVIRAFLYWKGKELSRYEGIDLDLSVLFWGNKANATPEGKDAISYYNPAIKSIDGIHSGDVRSSGNDGALEYVDFNIAKALKNGYRYAAILVNSYSGHPFAQMDAAFCGVMLRDGKTGKQFEPRTVENRYALTSNAQQMVSIVIDLRNREIITVDRTVHDPYSHFGNAYRQGSEIVACTQYAIEIHSLSIKEMLGLRFATFLKDSDWKNANVIISDAPNKFVPENEEDVVPRIVSPYDIPALYSLILEDN